MSDRISGHKPTNYGSKLQNKPTRLSKKLVRSKISNDGADHLFHEPFPYSVTQQASIMAHQELFHTKTTKSQTLKLKARKALNRDYPIIYYIKALFLKYKKIISYQILARLIQTSANHLPSFYNWI